LGGTSPAIAEAAKTVASYRAMLQCEMTKAYPDMDRIEFLSGQLVGAQENLAKAQSSATVTHTTHNNFQGARVQQFGISTSATNNDGEVIDPKVVEPMARAAAEIGREGLVEYESAPTSEASSGEATVAPSASAGPDSPPSEPPAGAAPVVPEGAGGSN
jgi:hypothetical protein